MGRDHGNTLCRCQQACNTVTDEHNHSISFTFLRLHTAMVYVSNFTFMFTVTAMLYEIVLKFSIHYKHHPLF